MEIMESSPGNPVRIRMRRPVDLHQHFRQGERLRIIAPLIAKRFAAAIAMPNLDPPITTARQMVEHAIAIEIATAANYALRVLGTFYLTDRLDPEEVRRACELGLIVGIKYYPRGLTTNSDAGVTDPTALWTPGTGPYQCLQVLAQCGKVLLLHAADGVARERVRIGSRDYSPSEELDPYDQEPHFVAHSLGRIREAHPNLKISFEHLSTAQGVEYRRINGGKYLGRALTP